MDDAEVNGVTGVAEEAAITLTGLLGVAAAAKKDLTQDLRSKPLRKRYLAH